EKLLPIYQQVSHDDAFSTFNRGAVKKEIGDVFIARGPHVEERLGKTIWVFCAGFLHGVAPRLLPAPLQPSATIQTGEAPGQESLQKVGAEHRRNRWGEKISAQHRFSPAGEIFSLVPIG